MESFDSKVKMKLKLYIANRNRPEDNKYKNKNKKRATRTCQSGFTSIIHKQSSEIAAVSLTCLINVSLISSDVIFPEIVSFFGKKHSSAASVLASSEDEKENKL